MCVCVFLCVTVTVTVSVVCVWLVGLRDGRAGAGVGDNIRGGRGAVGRSGVHIADDRHRCLFCLVLSCLALSCVVLGAGLLLLEEYQYEVDVDKLDISSAISSLIQTCNAPPEHPSERHDGSTATTAALVPMAK